MRKGIRELFEHNIHTNSQSFDEQLDIAEQLYGQHIQFSYDHAEEDALLSKESYYPANIKQRMRDLIVMQRRKYKYLF